MKKSNSTWLNVPDNYDDYVGFVYEILEIDTGMRYVGKTHFWYTFKKNPTKYKMKDGKWLKDKKGKRIPNTRTTKQHFKKEAKWKEYNSSSKVLKEKIPLNPDNYIKKIISCHKTITSLKLEECYLQIQIWKRGDWSKYYNGVINVKIPIK